MKFIKDNKYKFATTAPSELGARYEDMTVISEKCGVDLAQLVDENLYAKYKLVSNYINLPAIENMDFVIFVDTTGTKHAFGYEYINQETLEDDKELKDYTITYSQIDADAFALIQSALSSLHNGEVLMEYTYTTN